MTRSQQATAILSKYSSEVQASVKAYFRIRVKYGAMTKENIQSKLEVYFTDYLMFSFSPWFTDQARFYSELYKCYEELLTLF